MKCRKWKSNTDNSARHTSSLQRRAVGNSNEVGLRKDASSSGVISRSTTNGKFGRRRKFRERIHRHFYKLRPIDNTRHGERRSFIFKDLKNAYHIFLRHDRPKGILQLPYDVPFTVVIRDNKNFTILIYDKNITISIDRIKLIYLFSESLIDAGETTNNQWQQNQTHLIAIQTRSEDNERVIDQRKNKSSEGTGAVTRSGRRVRFRERFQGFI